MAEEIILRCALNKDYLVKDKEDQSVVCRLDIEPSESYRTRHQAVACDLCLVLDGSGSMGELFGPGFSITKRQGVMAAAKRIVDHLDPADTVSIVFYDSQAYIVGSAIPGSQGEQIRKTINTLEHYTGATNFEAALKAARKVLAKGGNASRRIIFLTDGQVNQGNARVVAQTVADLAREGATIDGLGVGADFDFNYMRGLSGPSNGRTFLLNTPEEANLRFEELLAGAQKVVANNVFLTVLFPVGLRDVEAYQWLPEMRYYGDLRPGPDGGARLEVNVQTLRQDRRNIFFFKARMDPPKDEATRLLAGVRLDYDLPPVQKTGLQDNLNIRVNFTDDKDLTEYDTDVDNGFREVELAKLDERFQEHRGGDWQKALSVLEDMIRRARDLNDSQRLAAYEDYKKKLQTEHRLSDDDFNRVGSISSVSTQTEEGYLSNSREEEILRRL
jgi:Mg-chelatase subunit ChlD